MSISNTSIIDKSSIAKYETDRESMQTLLEMTMQKIIVKNKGTIELKDGIITNVKLNTYERPERHPNGWRSIFLF